MYIFLLKVRHFYSQLHILLAREKLRHIFYARYIYFYTRKLYKMEKDLYDSDLDWAFVETEHSLKETIDEIYEKGKTNFFFLMLE